MKIQEFSSDFGSFVRSLAPTSCASLRSLSEVAKPQGIKIDAHVADFYESSIVFIRYKEERRFRRSSLFHLWNTVRFLRLQI